jgi:hypothetical protein
MGKKKYDPVREKLRGIIRERLGIDWVYHLSHGQRVYEIKRQVLVHFPASSRPGWWGVNVGVLGYLRRHAKPWFVVFLLVDGLDADGWLMDSQQWETFSRGLLLSKGAYKVTSKYFNEAVRIGGLQAIAETILGHVA